MTPTQFQGFPKEAFTFLRALKRNNRRDWFAPRKPTYEAHLKVPMQALITDLGHRFKDRAPLIRFDPKRSMFRIYRDVRFSADQSPYKTAAAASFNMGLKSGELERPGLYLHIEPGEVMVAGGLYMPNSAQLRLIRESILSRSDAFFKVIKNPTFKRRFGGLAGESLKRAPQGIDPAHPLIEHLKHKQFFVMAYYPDELALSRALLKRAQADFEAMLPLLTWLHEATAPLRFSK